MAEDKNGAAGNSRPPGVDALARSLADTGIPHPLLVVAARQAIAEGNPSRARAIALSGAEALLQPVINATGVLLHTNLGRAPRSAEGADAADAAVRYNNLEFDTAQGKRGRRGARTAELLAQLCGAEAAHVVNNCAAAVTLVLAGMAEGRGVVVSRSELVEIGGGFRVPEVISAGGARLIEVGTTNRTRRADYQKALDEPSNDAALCLKVHQSNYRIVGFTEAASTADLADLPAPLAVDIGSGLLDEACPWLRSGKPPWLQSEPAARQTLASGADLVTFSGDKLLGGPQAGIIAGKAEYVKRCSRHPLARAFRVGGLILDELQSLALTYLRRRGDDIPFWRMAALSQDELLKRAKTLGVGTPVKMTATTGGGTLPGIEIPSAGIRLDGDFTQWLRNTSGGRPPIVSRVYERKTYLDLRTVDPLDDAVLAEAIPEALKHPTLQAASA